MLRCISQGAARLVTAGRRARAARTNGGARPPPDDRLAAGLPPLTCCDELAVPPRGDMAASAWMHDRDSFWLSWAWWHSCQFLSRALPVSS